MRIRAEADDPFGLDVAVTPSKVLDKIMAIDPGLDGGIGMLQVPGWHVLAVRKLPTRDFLDRRVVDERALCAFVRELSPSIVIIEKVLPTPEARDDDKQPSDKKGAPKHRMGAVGSFHYGWTCGLIYTAVRLAGHDPVMVHPTTWKAAAGLYGRGVNYSARKRMSVMLARQHWPEVSIPTDGCAEALLIARFGLANQLKFF